MQKVSMIIGVCAVCVLGCTQPQPGPAEPRLSASGPIAWPEDWSPLLGSKVIVDGWAAEFKIGPQLYEDKALAGRSVAIWMKDKRWPDGYFEGAGKSKHVRLSGTVAKRNDVPVFLAEKGTGRADGDTTRNLIGPAGVPVYSQEEFERRQWRIVLTEVTWTVLD